MSSGEVKTFKGNQRKGRFAKAVPGNHVEYVELQTGSRLIVFSENIADMKKKGVKRKFAEVEEKAEEELPPATRFSDEPVKKKVKWINKQRVLILALRGITYLHRHLMEDLRTLLPHSKRDCKVEKSNDNLSIINEIAESKNCNKSILFETRRKTDLYMWVANNNGGPSAKFQVESIYTMKELKLTGNCLKGSRPFLSFDENFKSATHYQLLKELFTQIFSTPNHHPKSQPFSDHVYTFTVVDNRIWFRNYQILSEDGALAEIGPRFVLNPIKIFEGSFGGEVLWDNPHYVSPAMFRRQINKTKGNKYLDRKQQKQHYEETQPEKTYDINPLLDIFQGSALEKAEEILKEGDKPSTPAKAKAKGEKQIKGVKKSEKKKKKRKLGKKKKSANK